MKRRLMAACLVAFMLLSVTGCASLFKKEYLSVTEYQDGEKNPSSHEIGTISTYDELKNAIISMVNKHQTEGRLRFIGYSGALQTDINQARLEVMGENALAGFAVSYIAYDLSLVVTYYEAVFNITYKRSQSEIADILYITGRKELPELASAMLEGLETHRALRIISSTISAQEVEAALGHAYEKTPAASVVPPIVQVQIYPEQGLHRIVEVELEYGWKLSELQKMKSELSERLEQLTVDNNKAPVLRALTLYERLVQSCSYDPAGTRRARRSELDSGLGATAFGALVEGLADSRGVAAAFSALCHASGIECLIVNGSLEGESHSWNMIKVRGQYYHVDSSAFDSLGRTDSFMRSDKTMTSHGYDWDREAYPVCDLEQDATALES